MDSRTADRRWRAEHHVPWLSLPPEVMQKIFSFLSDADRCTARLVCHHWAEVFYVPLLWRYRRFTFRALDEGEVERAVLYLHTLGSHLRHMEIETGMPLMQNARQIAVAVETFMNACKARDVRLDSLMVSGLEFFQIPIYRIYRHRFRMVRALCTLLRRQKWLRNVNLACSQMGREDGGRVLKALTSQWRPPGRKNCRQPPAPPPVYLEHLELRDFFMDDVFPAALPVFLEEVGKFSAVRQLGLNLTYLSDAVLELLTSAPRQGLPLRLDTLDLSLDSAQTLQLANMTLSNLAVTSKGWKAAVVRRPSLRVFLDMRGRFRLVDFQRALLQGMPLKSLTVTSLVASLFYETDDMRTELVGLLLHLSQYFGPSLNAFHLKWGEPDATWSDSDALVQLVSRCRLLETLSLNFNVGMDTLLKVLAAASQNKMSAGPTTLSMNVVGVSRKELHTQLMASRAKLRTCVLQF